MLSDFFLLHTHKMRRMRRRLAEPWPVRALPQNGEPHHSGTKNPNTRKESKGENLRDHATQRVDTRSASRRRGHQGRGGLIDGESRGREGVDAFCEKEPRLATNNDNNNTHKPEEQAGLGGGDHSPGVSHVCAAGVGTGAAVTGAVEVTTWVSWVVTAAVEVSVLVTLGTAGGASGVGTPI